MATFLSWVFALSFVGALFVYHGWVMSTLWEWFVVPLGAPRIGWAQFVGIVLLVAVVRNKPMAPRKWKTEEIAAWAAFPACAVLIGLLLRGFL
jgi:hypothetical protein